jgi:hypothetical protein
VLFSITIPCDARLCQMVRQIAERAAQCAGYTGDDAAGMAAAVVGAAEKIMAIVGGEPLGISFERKSSCLDVVIRYPLTAPGSGAISADTVVSNQAVQQGVQSVEFGVDDEMAYCRLRRVLPREKVDHQCEIPPP